MEPTIGVGEARIMDGGQMLLGRDVELLVWVDVVVGGEFVAGVELDDEVEFIAGVELDDEAEVGDEVGVVGVRLVLAAVLEAGAVVEMVAVVVVTILLVIGVAVSDAVETPLLTVVVVASESVEF